MSMMRKAIVVVILSTLALPLAAPASDLDERWGVGLETGLMKLIWGERDYSNLDNFGGVRLRHGLSTDWTLDINFMYGYIRPGVEQPGESAGLTTKSGAGFYTTMLQPTAGVQYRFSPLAKFVPYAGASIGILQWKVRNHKGDDNVPTFPDGPTLEGYDKDGSEQRLKSTNITIGAVLGLEYFVSEKFAFDVGLRYHQLLGNNVDNVGMSSDLAWGSNHVDANTALVEGFVGATLYFGSSDSDGDGIANAADACPKEAEDFDGYADADGCPDPDNDADGIADAEDACPDEAEDVDGFEDTDGWPRTPAPMKPRMWMASRTRTAAPIRITTATASSMRGTTAPTRPRIWTASKTRTAAPISTTMVTAWPTPRICAPILLPGSSSVPMAARRLR
jgi:opacity protein-like surface antigen